MAKYLDYSGVSIFWTKIKQYFNEGKSISKGSNNVVNQNFIDTVKNPDKLMFYESNYSPEGLNNIDSCVIDINVTSQQNQFCNAVGDWWHRHNDDGKAWNTWRKIYDSSNYTTIPVATTSKNGLLSKEDKSILKNLSNVYVALNGNQTINDIKSFNQIRHSKQTKTFIGAMSGKSLIEFPVIGYESLVHWKTKDGHVSIASHSSNDNNVVIGYMSNATQSAGSNRLDTSIIFNPKESLVYTNLIKADYINHSNYDSILEIGDKSNNSYVRFVEDVSFGNYDDSGTFEQFGYFGIDGSVECKTLDAAVAYVEQFNINSDSAILTFNTTGNVEIPIQTGHRLYELTAIESDGTKHYAKVMTCFEGNPLPIEIKPMLLQDEVYELDNSFTFNKVVFKNNKYYLNYDTPIDSNFKVTVDEKKLS